MLLDILDQSKWSNFTMMKFFIICMPIVLQNYSSIFSYGEVTVAGEGLYITTYIGSAPAAFEQGLSSSCCGTGPRFLRPHPRDSPN